MRRNTARPPKQRAGERGAALGAHIGANCSKQLTRKLCGVRSMGRCIALLCRGGGGACHRQRRCHVNAQLRVHRIQPRVAMARPKLG
jgi:hypothetical protein